MIVRIKRRSLFGKLLYAPRLAWWAWRFAPDAPIRDRLAFVVWMVWFLLKPRPQSGAEAVA
jgi:hypothetical protein